MPGFFAGGLAGLAVSSGCTGDDYCGVEGTLIGAIGVPIAQLLLIRPISLRGVGSR